jgi:hypothetical protein
LALETAAASLDLARIRAHATAIATLQREGTADPLHHFLTPDAPKGLDPDRIAAAVLPLLSERVAALQILLDKQLTPRAEFLANKQALVEAQHQARILITQLAETDAAIARLEREVAAILERREAGMLTALRESRIRLSSLTQELLKAEQRAKIQILPPDPARAGLWPGDGTLSAHHRRRHAARRHGDAHRAPKRPGQTPSSRSTQNSRTATSVSCTRARG